VGEVHFRPAVLADAALLARDLRPADRAEVIAASGPDVLRTVRAAVHLSTDAWVAEKNGELIALFGIAPVSLMGGIGSIWFLGTPVVDQLGRSLTRFAREYLRLVLATEYTVLMNYVDARNAKSVRWLQRLGFTLHAAEPYGVAGLPFHKFEMRS
jgi:hypothetical protein